MRSEEVPEAVRKAMDEKDAEIAELRKSVETEKATRERNELIVEVEKSYGHVPGKSAEEMADMLLKARAAGGDLEKELRELEREYRHELPKEIKRALALGDLRENAEYQAALERQGLVRSRID